MTDGRPARALDRTPWVRTIATPVRDFLSAETGGAAVMVAATLAAVAWANSPWRDSYESVWTTGVSIRVGGASVSQDVRHWVNDGLMALFFLVLGLEARRELDVGQLRERRRAAIPVGAAFGGMAAAVAIYLAFNAGGAGAHGWAVAMSTDTAFALAVLSVVAPNGTRLRVRLLTLAVSDDLLSLAVIAVVYTQSVRVVPLAVAVGLLGLLLAIHRSALDRFVPAAFAIAVALWLALFEAGIDPVIAGLLVGLSIGAHAPPRVRLEQVMRSVRSFREQPTPELARTAQRGVASSISPNERLVHRLHPWTSFVVVPLFALANAGIRVDADVVARAIRSPITLGIVIGYGLGKPLGVLAWTGIAARLGLSRRVVSWPVTGAVGVVAGVGFTLPLLIASLAFDGPQLAEAKLGILATAVVASAGGWVAFRAIGRLPLSVRARQLARTAGEIVDLSDDVDPARDHVRGAADAPVTLVEYGDYECPYCGRAEEVVRDLLRSFGDDLRYVWRHLPLDDVHPDARLAAEAAEAAGAQGAFWEMHDMLFRHQDRLAPGDVRGYAGELGLDGARFWDDVSRHRHARRIDEDIASADASGVAGTPSFFVNGRRHHGAFDTVSLTAAVSAARARAVALARARGRRE